MSSSGSRAEGIETALAARTLGFSPIWALGSAWDDRALTDLGGLEGLTLVARTDANGENERECECARGGAGRLASTVGALHRSGLGRRKRRPRARSGNDSWVQAAPSYTGRGPANSIRGVGASAEGAVGDPARIAEYLKRRIPGTAMTKHVADDFLMHGWFDRGEPSWFTVQRGGEDIPALDICLYLAALEPGTACPSLNPAGGSSISSAKAGGAIPEPGRGLVRGHPELAAAARSNFEVIPVRSDFHGTDDAECLASPVQGRRTGLLIVIDTLACEHGRRRRKHSRDTSRVYTNAAILQRADQRQPSRCHHTGKDTTQAPADRQTSGPGWTSRSR